jgi:hypothetical protein
MKCESCDSNSVACTSQWLNDEAMKVLYWCAEHAPVDAEWFFERPQYTRHDVQYDTWYNAWMKQLAKDYTLLDLSGKLRGASHDANKAAKTHLKAIERTHSMTGNSQARAQSRNVVAATGEYKIALQGAIEIHILFPEMAKGGSKC